MPFSISNKEQLSYIAETTWGTTPATPTFKVVRYVSDSFKTETTSVMSNEITTSREVSDHIRTAAKGTGSFNFEASYGLLDDFLEAMLGGTWTTNVLQVGTTKTSFSIQRGFSDITQFELYTGAIPSAMTLNVGIGKIVDGSCTFVSKHGSIGAVDNATGYTAVTTNSVWNPIDNIQLVQENSITIPGVTAFTINLQNQIVEFPQLSNIDPADLESGRIAASGTIDIYFQDATYITKYLNWTTTSLEFKLGGTGTTDLDFLFSKVKLSQASTDNPGINQPLITKFNWVAFKDATNSTVKVTRTP